MIDLDNLIIATLEAEDDTAAGTGTKLYGAEKEAVANLWRGWLLEDPVSYIYEFRSLGYPVETKRDLMRLTDEMEFFQIQDNFVMARYY